jgi:hypothetical protein
MPTVSKLAAIAAIGGKVFLKSSNAFLTLKFRGPDAQQASQYATTKKALCIVTPARVVKAGSVRNRRAPAKARV